MTTEMLQSFDTLSQPEMKQLTVFELLSLLTSFSFLTMSVNYTDQTQFACQI